ncbi:MAG: mevalonate kinase [Candidatus Nitrosocaldus sp.]|nr:mevalonate kinase [Candidatus Nitrosocaldus sp.]MDW7999863.1 mevalonate kinase [Candidatus Nitrosocaldus sp.]
MRAVASAPAKAILFGEHFVVYGKPAIATALERRVRATSTINNAGEVRVRSMLGYSRMDLESIHDPNLYRDDPHRHIIFSAAGVMRLLERYTGVDILLESDFPYGMGLGASAATSVATIASVGSLLGRVSRDEVFRLSVEAERLVHRNPSGIDSAVCTYGGLVLFKDGRVERLDKRMYIDMHFMVVNSGIMKDTGAMVMRVKARGESSREEFASLAEMSEQLTMQALYAMGCGDRARLGELLTLNHGLLRRLGVSNAVLDGIVHALLKNGAYGAKLTGAGGGGCIISLIDSSSTPPPDALSRYETFTSGVEEQGVITGA